MAKIIVTIDDTVVREVTLAKERITIGRRPHNDVVIDDIAVSAEHATIVTNFNDSLLEDLNSTNGTQVNGQPVKKHFLQHNDVIELARYNIRYVADSFHPGPASPDHPPAASQHGAVIRVLNGASAGKELGLTKALTTIGRPGIQVAVITQRAQGYSVTHVEGDAYPLVNGKSIGAAPYALGEGDVIELSGTRMAFSLLPDLDAGGGAG